MSSDVAAGSGLVLGAGMADRARSQSVLTPHRTSATLIGAVGRASVGFGLAVGRSRSIRPIVNLCDVNSAALRPPTEFWREPVSDVGSDGHLEADVAPSATRSNGGRTDTIARSAPRTASPASSNGVRRTADVRRPPRRSRPTWTDQVIQRSAIGYVARPSEAAPEALPVPDDFEPLGDPKVDHLRLLMRSFESAANDELVARPAVARTRSAVATPTPERAGAPAPRHARGDTAAGRATGPGRLGRAIRPERAEDRSAAARAARPGPGSAVGVDRPASSVDGASSTGRLRRREADRPAPTPSKVDQLRAIMIEQGLLPADAGDDSSPRDSPAGSTATDRSERGGSDGSTVRRRPPTGGPRVANDAALGTGEARRRTPVAGVSTSTSADLRRAAKSAVVSSPPSSTGSSSTASPSTASSSTASPSTGSSPTGSSPTGSSRRSSPTGSPIGPTGSSPTRSSPTRSSPTGSEPTGPRSATLSSTLGGPTDGRSDSATASSADASAAAIAVIDPPSASQPTLAESRRMMRSQRLLRSGLTPHGRDTANPIESPSTRLENTTAYSVDASSDAAVRLQRAASDQSAAIARRVETVRPALPWSLQPPQLPSPSDSDRMIRRVTLPRALSSSFRPDTALSVQRRHRHQQEAAPGSIDSSPFRSTAPEVTERRPSRSGSVDAPGTDVVMPGAATTIAARPTATTTTTTTTTATAVAPAPAISAPSQRTSAVQPPARVKSTELPRVGRPAPHDVATSRTSTSTSPTRTNPTRTEDHRVSAGPTIQSTPATPASAGLPSASAPSTVSMAAAAGAGVREIQSDPVVRPATVPASTAGTPNVLRRLSTVPAGPGALSRVLRRAAATGTAGGPEAVSPPMVGAADRTESATGRAARRAADVPIRSSARQRSVRRSALDLASTSPAVPLGPEAGDDARAEQRSDRLADQFMTELSQTIQRTPAPLPTTFRPMADMITGGQRVMLSTDPASRRALRSVGKVAATTGSTIHLDHTAIPQARLHEVVAHELTHVAHPSPTPRFFDDVDDSPEERRAEQVAAIIARSPLAPSSSVVAPRSSSGADRTIRRTPAPPSSPSPSVRSSSAGGAPSMSADALAARLTGSSSAPSSGSVIRRSPAPSTATAALAATAADPQVIRRLARDEDSSTTTKTSSPFADTKAAEAWFDKEFEKRLAGSIDPLLRMIEDRMIVELERRGGRSWRSS